MTARRDERQQQVIRERAYAIWEQEGHPDGKDLAHWLQAETEIDSAHALLAAKSGSPSPRVLRQWFVGWYSVAKDGTDWHDALQQVQLAGNIAKRVADLGLHRFDMDFCERILKEYGSRLVAEYDDLSQALWIAVLTKFISCFRSSEARGLLKESKVYGSNPKALQAFDWILNLRNKHVAHDVNSYYGAAAFAWLEQDRNVRQVGVMTYVTRLDPALVGALRYLVDRAQEHIRIAIADAGKALLAEVQAMSPEARAALEKIRFALPTDPYADLTDTRQSAT